MAYQFDIRVLGASDVGAPHKRERIWIVNHARSVGCDTGRDDHTSHDRAESGSNGQHTDAVADAGRAHGNRWPRECVAANRQTCQRNEAADHAQRCCEVVADTNQQHVQDRPGRCLQKCDGQLARGFGLSLPAAVAVAQRSYPTATATAYKGWSPNHNRADTDDRLDYTIEREAFSPGQQTPPMRLNPAWVELLMGWPLDWTNLQPMNKGEFDAWSLGFSAKEVQELRQGIQPQAIQWPTGGCNCLPKAGALQPDMREQQGINNARGLPMAGQATPQDVMRGMWLQEAACSSSLRSRPDEQRSKQLANTVQPLPRLLARYGEEAWKDGSWEDAVPRVTNGVAHRSHRLKAIGNGQVPRVAATAWNLLMEAA